MKLALFGAGQICREAIELLQSEGKTPEIVIDNDEAKDGIRIYGIPVLSFPHFLKENDGGYQIIITCKPEYEASIQKQLIAHGIRAFESYERSRKWGMAANGLLRDDWVKKKLLSITGGQSLLDAGAGEQRYRKYCAHIWSNCLRNMDIL